MNDAAGIDKEQAPNLLMLVHLPPPVHGISAVSAAAVAAFSSHITVRTINLSYGSLTPRLDNALRYFGPILRSAWAVAKPGGRGRARCYMTASGGRRLIVDLALILLCKLNRRRLILHHHSTAYIKTPALTMRAIYGLLGPQDASIFLDAQHRADFNTVYANRTHTFCVSNSALLMNDTAAKPGHVPRKSASIGFLSNIELTKGIDAFLDLCSDLRAAGIAIDPIVAGPFRDREAERLTTEAAERGLIRYLGPVYGPEKGAFFDAIDLLVFPSRYVNETEPLVVLEAMAAGIPVLATEAGYIRQMLGSASELALPSGEFRARAPGMVRRIFADYANFSHLMVENFIARRNASDYHLHELVAELGYPE